MLYGGQSGLPAQRRYTVAHSYSARVLIFMSSEIPVESTWIFSKHGTKPEENTNTLALRMTQRWND